MRRTIFVALGASAFISSTAAISIGAGSVVPDHGMNREEFQAALSDLQQARTATLARCEAIAAAFERELCRTEGAAAESVRVAEFEQAYRRTEASARALQRARIDARYQVDRARCNFLGGARRDRCMVQVHAAKGRALLDAAAPYEARS